MSPLSQLFSALAGPALARQLALVDFLGERAWSVDLDRGQVSFGEELTYPMQLLGTESYHNDTWLWSWANPSQINPRVLEAAQELREYGTQHHLTELTTRSCAMSTMDGHRLSMLSSGLIRKTAYYLGPYDGGALYFLIFNLPPEIFGRVLLPRVCTVLGQLIETFELDHRLMAESFLQEQGFALSSTLDGMHGVRDDGDTIDLDFDSQSRITQINASASGDASGDVLS